MPYGRPILIVDDDTTILQIFSEILAVVGLESICLSDPAQALPLLEAQPVEIVITDVNMPGLDGLALLRRIKDFEGRTGRSVLVFVVTAFSDSQKAIQALRDGAFCYLSKPVKSQALLLHLKRAINQLSPGDGDAISLAALAPPSRADSQAPPRSGGRSDTNGMACTGSVPAAGTDADLLSTLHFPLDPLSVGRHAPAQGGVLTLRDAKGKALCVEWSENVNARLGGYVASGPTGSEAARRARYFEFFLTDYPSLVAKFFDKIVNESGAFPLCQSEAPKGSKYFGQKDPESGQARASDGEVTRYTVPKDVGLVEKVKALLEKSPDNRELQDWYAFLLYSNGLLDEAIERYEGLIHDGSQKADHFFYLGNAYYKKNRPVEAVESWMIATELAPSSKIGRKAALRVEKVKAGISL